MQPNEMNISGSFLCAFHLFVFLLIFGFKLCENVDRKKFLEERGLSSGIDFG